MDEEYQGYAPVEEPQGSMEQTDGASQATPDINDLGDAFVFMRQAEQEAAQGSVDNAGTDTTAGQAQQETTQPAVDRQPQGYQQSGAVPTNYQRVNWSTPAQGWVDQVNQAAIQAARQDERFTKLKPMYVENLMKRLEDGTVIYVNPDDNEQTINGYNYRGQSREQAEKWCDSYNNWVKRQQQSIAKEYQKQIAEAAAPQMRLIQFGATYDRMSDAAKEMMDDIIAPYAIMGDDGIPVGYDCDLNQAARMATQLASKYGRQQQQQQQQPVQQQPKQPTGPALDMKSRNGNSGGYDIHEPKDLADAMEMMMHQQLQNGGKK